jgi:hypothetical protein
MSPDQIFSLANLVALVAWVAIVFFPRRGGLVDLISGDLVPGLLAVAYTAIVVVAFGGAEGGFSSLAAVATLFQNPWLLLAGWLHYLAFDLLIGCWQAGDARARGVPHLLLVPCLALTFLFGPAGWLLYRIVRLRYAPRPI